MSPNPRRSLLGAIAASLLVLAFALPVAPASADDDGDTAGVGATLAGHGYRYTAGGRVNAWEGTYAILPAGETRQEVWCSQSGFRLPEDGQVYSGFVPLSYRSGAVYPAGAMAQLAVKIAYAQQVFDDPASTPQTLNDYGSAMALIIHRDTSDDIAFPYAAIRTYLAGQSAINGGNVPAVVDQLDTIGTTYPAPWTITATIDAPPDAAVGDAVTVTIAVTAGANGIPGRIVDLTGIGGLAGLPASVTVGPDGTAVLPATLTSTRATLRASLVGPSAIVEMRVPVAPYLPSETGSVTQPQTMVFVGTGASVAADPAIQVDGTASIAKVDAANGAVIAGATIEIRDAGGVLVTTLTSGATPTVIRLPEGNYTAVETAAPRGYLLNAAPLAFTIAPGSVFPVVVSLADTAASDALAFGGASASDVVPLAFGILLAGALLLGVRRRVG